MPPKWPAIAGAPAVTAVLRQSPDDFRVYEQLGFELSGAGEHVFLHLQKQELNSMELLQRIARLSGIMARDIGLSGLKDRNAVTQQWFSVRMAGRAEPNWLELEQPGDVKVLQVSRHLRKLKRGVHKANRFVLCLRELSGNREDLLQRLQRVKAGGFANYFGGQRFGRGGSTLTQARQWMGDGGRKISRANRSLYLSALRSLLFNTLLADRVIHASWNCIVDGDACNLQGTRSLFSCDRVDDEIRARALRGDIHPALPLWGRGRQLTSAGLAAQQAQLLSNGTALSDGNEICRFLERMELELAYRPARALAGDFSWQFCEDDSLILDFTLGTGCYATAMLAELVRH